MNSGTGIDTLYHHGLSPHGRSPYHPAVLPRPSHCWPCYPPRRTYPIHDHTTYCTSTTTPFPYALLPLRATLVDLPRCAPLCRQGRDIDMTSHHLVNRRKLAAY